MQGSPKVAQDNARCPTFNVWRCALSQDINQQKQINIYLFQKIPYTPKNFIALHFWIISDIGGKQQVFGFVIFPLHVHFSFVVRYEI